MINICFPQVEFPEARIYEETLNILLYENRNGPDQELMQATSSRGAVACTSDEEEGERSGLARLRSNKQNTNWPNLVLLNPPHPAILSVVRSLKTRINIR